MKVIQFYWSLILCSFLIPVQAQSGFQMSFLDYGKRLPSTLLNSNSIGLISFTENPGAELDDPPDVMELCKSVHKDFADLGINVVGYYNSDGFSGLDAKDAFLDVIKENDVKNIVMLVYSEHIMQGKSFQNYSVIFTKYNGKETLYDHNQEAYLAQADSYEKLQKEFSKAVEKSKLSKAHLEISVEPKIIYSPDVIKGDIFESLPADLSNTVLYVPQFEVIDLPDEKPSGLSMKLAYKSLQKQNKDVEKNNEKLQSIIESYPYNYQMINYFEEVGDLVDKKDGYLLLAFKGSERTWKQIYDPNHRFRDVTDMSSGAWGTKTSTEPYVKYYIKDLKTKDVYIGDWDASGSWEGALDHFINAVK